MLNGCGMAVGAVQRNPFILKWDILIIYSGFGIFNWCYLSSPHQSLRFPETPLNNRD